MTTKLIIALASLIVASIIAAIVRRRETAPTYFDHTTSAGVRCVSCSTVMKPGSEPFAGGLCIQCGGKP